jgi:translation initiation factor IF-1
VSAWKWPVLSWIRRLLGHGDKPADMADYYPARMAVRCENAKHWALDRVQNRTGKTLRKLYGWTVVLKPCPWSPEKGRYCWRVGAQWVVGLTEGRATQMACGPDLNPNDVSDGDLRAEAIRYWMDQNGMKDPARTIYPEVWR